MKLGYEIKQSTNIDKNEFLKICNNLKISRTLLDEVGNDYFEASLSYFIGSDAAFQIDAGTVNKKKFLVFIISAKQRCPFSFLFDIDMNFDPTLNGYRKSVYDRIKKAKEKGINIIGIVSDNLPVQIKAISHESKCSIQKKYTDVSCIIHLRCCNHLLNLAYRDWIKFDNELTDYETNVKKISIILNNQKFYRYIKKKIPVPNITRWNSTYKSLEKIISIMDSIISLYKNPPKKIICDLIKMKDSILYILNVGLPKVYPFLFYFEKLTNQIQKENVSCVEAILIIEHYLHKMKDNIIKYEIESGFELINSIKKRLLLNHNVQLYQLASLFTPDGIVRYRKKMKGYTEYNIIEDENIYFKTLKNQNIIDQSENSEFILNNSNLINKFKQHNDTIDQFYDKFKSKKNWYIKSKTNKSTHNLDLKKSNKNKCVQKILTTYFQSYNESERTKIQNNIEDATKRYQMYKNGKRNEYISNKLIDLDENHIISSDDADEEVENEENLQNDTNTNEYNDKDKRKKEFELEESKDDIEEKLSDDEDSEDLEEEEEYENDDSDDEDSEEEEYENDDSDDEDSEDLEEEEEYEDEISEEEEYDDETSVVIN